MQSNGGILISLLKGKNKFTEMVRLETELLGWSEKNIRAMLSYRYYIINNYLKCCGNGRR